MNNPRRAASARSAVGFRIAIGALAGALTLVLGSMAALTTVIARRVVVPTPRARDTRILDLDVKAQTITLSRTADTELPGRYGLFTGGTMPYLKLGSILSENATTVTRKLLTEVDSGAKLEREASFSGWYYDAPDQLHLPYQPELIGTPLGPCPAWLFPGGDTWVIQVHGRGAARAECLRAVPLFHDAGITSLVVSYRNDGEGPRSRTGTYGLGATEWRDVDEALGYARRHGAKRVLLMGWSMGGAIALQVATRSAHRDLIAGLILESPVVDWRPVLTYQAQANGIPSAVGDLAVAALGQDWSAKAVGADHAIPFDALDIVAQAESLKLPILILHSDDDGFVPATASHALAEARPDLVKLETYAVARHTKLWNYDQARWDSDISGWLAANGFTPKA
ncbi:alpha/beta hydrolase family protein [Microbacterium gorillae]|uniref:alpha/beta hydrolase family protein n=1 Tax=Microbacterium gorillae TaxID=1231063 RepID=UPI00058B39F7|nr:alpha/beta fold hydrolase [Microbacterium gorillae]